MNTYSSQLEQLSRQGNLRSLPAVDAQGLSIVRDGNTMLNFSSNDYLGLADDTNLKEEFLQSLNPRDVRFSSTSSRLLTGNFPVYARLEKRLAELYKAETSLVFNSGYHANSGILPAVTDNRSLILADKLVHASIVDGIGLSKARCIRYRHNDYEQLERLVSESASQYEAVFIVTESIFSMDGDESDLPCLVALKKHYPNIYLYVDEAHAFGVRGQCGLGCAEEQDVIKEIDFLVGTFGKAAASVGAFVICSDEMKRYLVNKMRTLIFTTALPPVNLEWTLFIIDKIVDMQSRREHLEAIGPESKTSAQPVERSDCQQQPYRPLRIGRNGTRRTNRLEITARRLLSVAGSPAHRTARNLPVKDFAERRTYRYGDRPAHSHVNQDFIGPMIQTFISRRHTDDLILLFAGWGMDTHPFACLNHIGCDCCVCYDYTDLNFDTTPFLDYKNIEVYAWSFGVWAAATVLPDKGLPIRHATAINGTECRNRHRERHPPRNIPATLEHLNEASLKKFYRRMCCEHLDDFKEAFPERDINSLYDELHAIGENITLHPRPRFRWDKAIIGTRDLIFPAKNQVNAWEGTTVVQELDEPHFSFPPGCVGK